MTDWRKPNGWAAGRREADRPARPPATVTVAACRAATALLPPYAAWVKFAVALDLSISLLTP
ncbi:hypothetical protein [Streptomyces sp. NPDC052302]|uniref:hypothetical protein n=1 Tax=Streptomyces sp. NPDC052302 TaxID=3365688 RepID=UPI0037D3700E